MQPYATVDANIFVYVILNGELKLVTSFNMAIFTQITSEVGGLLYF